MAGQQALVQFVFQAIPGIFTLAGSRKVIAPLQVATVRQVVGAWPLPDVSKGQPSSLVTHSGPAFPEGKQAA